MINKITSLTAVAVLSMSLLFTNCKKKDDATPAATTTTTAATTTTPPATTSPYNFKCKLDGNEYNCTNGTGTIQAAAMTFIDFSGSKSAYAPLAGMILRMAFDDLKVGTFKITKKGYGGEANGIYQDNGTPYKYYSTTDAGAATDVLTITKCDLTAKKVSGTFNFTAFGNSTTTGSIVVTEGEFTDLTW